MKTLLLDIETAPNLVYVWGMWKQNVTMDKIVDNGHVLCWSAKWLGERDIACQTTQTGTKSMLRAVHKLLDEADVVIHYNGKSFDIPTLNREFLTNEMAPPAPYKQVDLLEVVKDRFNFPINKLDYVCKRLGIGEKVRHPGFQMWVDCMAGKDEAWEKMTSYNRHDVVILERLYAKLRPWIRNHPNVGAFDDRPEACPHCGEEGTLQRRGFAVTRDRKYARYACQDCGAWCRGVKALTKTKMSLVGIS